MSSLPNTHRGKLRKQLFIAPKAQGRLMYRAMLHVVLAAAATGLVCVAITSLTEISNSLAAAVAVGTVSLIAVPISLIETARTSNEVLGPFVRVQGAIRRLAYGEDVSKLAIRDGDMWREWIQEFNVMLEQLQREKQQAAESDVEDTSTTTSHVTLDEMSVR